MKKLFLSITAALLASLSYAQTNTFPSSGSVGIGTTSPYSPLDVVGSWGAFSATAHVISQFVQDHTNNRGVYIGFDSAGQIGIIAGNSATAASNLAFWNNNGSAWFEAMRLTSAGNLGIGTTSPANKLDVQGGNASIYNTGSTSSLLIGSSANGKSYLVFGTSADAGGYGIIQSVSASGSLYGNMVFNPTAGNVLIGKTTQTNSAYILDVNGAVRANQVVINSTGADFVFAPTYKLNSLSYLKKYISQNHHLPEIPSAAQMKANGLNVGDNQVKLLQKVEELTLYLIEQNKKIEDQQKQLDQYKARENNSASQQDRINKLEVQLSSLINKLKEPAKK